MINPFTLMFKMKRIPQLSVFTNSAKNNAEKVRDWCIDNLYEFIPANLRIPSHCSLFDSH